MRKIALTIVGVLLCLGAGVSGCGVLFVRLAAFEPPHPEWTAPATGIATQTTRPLSPGDYYLWISEEGPTGPCTLEVKRSDGSLVGKSRGSSCSVHGKARSSEEVWTVDARGTGRNAAVSLGYDVELLPSPLHWIMLGLVALFVLGIVAIAFGVKARNED